jgi:biuret amidohydrolase
VPTQTKQLATDVVADSVTAFRLDVQRVALVVIDMQYASASRSAGLGRLLTELAVPEEEAEYRFERLESVVVPSLRRLLDTFRELGAAVVHVRLGSSVAGCRDLAPSFRRVEHAIGNYVEQREFDVLDELAPVSGEPVVTKLSASGFTSSNLDALLRNLGVEQLVVGGVSTSHCVDLTARDAADRGYDVAIVDDACAEDTPELHTMSLRVFGKLFGRVVTADDAINELRVSAAQDGRR